MTTLTDRCDEAMARALCHCDEQDGSMPWDGLPETKKHGISWQWYRDRSHAARVALLSELDAAGWQVVPKVATEQKEAEETAIDLAQDAWNAQTSHEYSTDGLGAACWAFHESMLAAAPHPFPEDKP